MSLTLTAVDEPVLASDPSAETRMMQSAYDALSELPFGPRLRAVDWLLARVEADALAGGHGLMRA